MSLKSGVSNGVHKLRRAKMRRLWPTFLILFLLQSYSSTAVAEWGNTRWGMSMDEARVAFPALVELRVSDQWGRTLTGRHHIDEFDINLNLSFLDNKLVGVGLSPNPVSDCEKLRDRIAKTLGPGKTTPKANGAYRYDWINDRDVISLDQGMPAPKSPDHCFLLYYDREQNGK